MWLIFGGVFLGWSLGTNDAANVFGTAVASRIVRFRTAAILAALFVLIGALSQGQKGIEQVGGLSNQTALSAVVVSVAAALTVTVMTALRLPVSTSQAVVGAIIGMGFVGDPQALKWGQIFKMVACWVGTPIGAAVLAFALYPLLSWGLRSLRLGLVARAMALKLGLIVAGCYGAYALGANNVANVVGVYYDAGLVENALVLALIGGGAIALGVLTYSKNVMMTVGRSLVELDAFSALVAVLAMAVTVHVYAHLGVPVSTSQAIVGGVLGIGLFKGLRTINRRTVINILFAWLNTPLVAGVICWAGARMFIR